MSKRRLHDFLTDKYHDRMMPVVRLNRQEKQLRSLLVDVTKFINEAGLTTQPVVVRWAGGWVRDKLLGAESHDIDVAINAMTGVDFAHQMRQYCTTEQAIKKHSIGAGSIGNLHNVARNPDKSKHLETAMLTIYGIELDLVNLRRETYAENSRNPNIEFGTPQEDALRRDATINALFYNLDTEKIEDFTGGIRDLGAKVIRTPLSPLETFKDDPLRILRLIRFASRLEFVIDPKTRDVMAHEQVLESLKVKISRERIGAELEKMLKGKRPRASLELIDKLCLYHAIFSYSIPALGAKPDAVRWHVAYNCLHDIVKNDSPGSVGQLLVRSDDAMYVAWNLAALSPWMTIDYPADELRKANVLPPVSVAAREGFKAPNKLTDTITASYRHRREIMAFKQGKCNEKPVTNTRATLGMAIRRWDAHGGPWTLQVLSAMLVEAMETLHTWPEPESKARDEFIDGWQRFLDRIIDLDVYDAPALKRLLDGRSLAKVLGVKPDKWTGKALDVCLEWQLRNPGETNPTGAIEEIRLRREELGIPDQKSKA